MDVGIVRRSNHYISFSYSWWLGGGGGSTEI